MGIQCTPFTFFVSLGFFKIKTWGENLCNTSALKNKKIRGGWDGGKVV